MTINRWEKHHAAIAKAAINGDEIDTSVTSGLDGRNLVCMDCQGCGMCPNEAGVIGFCSHCGGAGFVVVGKPKQVSSDMGLSK